MPRPAGPMASGRFLGPTGKAIAFATAQPGDRWKAAANARLMAAAPDMEKALEMYIQAEDSELPSVEQFLWAGEAARAALAKARGETDA